MDPVITNVDSGSVIHDSGKFQDNVLTAAGALTIVDGTILGRLTATGKLAVFASGAATGAEIPVAVFTGADLVIAGAGDVTVRALVSGQVRRERLIEQTKAAGVDITNVVTDQLRNYSIVPIDTTELNVLDNQ